MAAADPTSARTGLWRVQVRWAVVAFAAAVGVALAWPDAPDGLATGLGLAAGAATVTDRPSAAIALALVPPLAMLGGWWGDDGALLAAPVATLLVLHGRPHPIDRWDPPLAILAAVGLAGLGTGVGAIGPLLLPPVGDVATVLFAHAAVAAAVPLAIVPAARRHDHPEPPGVTTWSRLPRPLQDAVRRASRLARGVLPHAPDTATRRRVVALAHSVGDLQRRRAAVADAHRALRDLGDDASDDLHGPRLAQQDAALAERVDALLDGLRDLHGRMLVRAHTLQGPLPAFPTDLLDHLDALDRDDAARSAAAAELAVLTPAGRV